MGCHTLGPEPVAAVRMARPSWMAYARRGGAVSLQGLLGTARGLGMVRQ
jgi:hypothetical protein